MSDENQEQRINLKFLVKCKKIRLSAINCCKRPMGTILYLVHVFLNGVSASVIAKRALKMTRAQVALSLFQLRKQ